MKYLFRGIVLSLLMSLGMHSAMASATDDFRKGQQAFKQGDYQAALRWFRKARRQGLNNAAIFYNLGVTHYKLRQYGQAEKASCRPRVFPSSPPWLGTTWAWSNASRAIRRRPPPGSARRARTPTIPNFAPWPASSWRPPAAAGAASPMPASATTTTSP